MSDPCQPPCSSASAQTRHPNIFDYATSELSQDAFLCWLIAWAKEDYRCVAPSLHAAALQFLRECFELPPTKLNVPTKIGNIDIKRQDQRVDIVVLINDTHLLAIEDKVFASVHGDQLTRYKASLDAVYADRPYRTLVYYKTGNQSDYSAPIKAGFKVFDRQRMLGVLRSAISKGCTSELLISYTDHLTKIDDATNNYHNIDPKWGPDRLEWQGLYMWLQKELGGAKWDYVPNPNGGFLAFWWAYRESHGFKTYLQLEQHKMCVKMDTSGLTLDQVREKVETWQHCMRTHGHKDLPYPRLGKLGKPNSSVTLHTAPYLQADGDKVNLLKTLQALREYEELHSKVIRCMDTNAMVQLLS